MSQRYWFLGLLLVAVISLPQVFSQEPSQAFFQAESIYQESDGLVIIEAEDSASAQGLWETKTQIEGFTGTGYIEYQGKSPVSGPPKAPQNYSFKIHKEGLYYLHLHCARETVVIKGKERHDVANDGYVRVRGNFGAGPKKGSSHGDDAPLSMLREHTKFYGGDDHAFVWASGNRLDPGGHNNKRVAVYHFKAGEVYQFTLSGRSAKFKVNRILFRHKDVSVEDAQDLSLEASKVKERESEGALTGELRQWHKVTLSWEGPASSETAVLNPFLDYRLDVEFRHKESGTRYVVPGYYAADGDSANTHADSGNVWRAHFAPDRTGEWGYRVSFKKGTDIAVLKRSKKSPSAGFFDGDRGQFSIEASDKTGRDFRSKGRLSYVGKHHLQFEGTKEYFLKAGPDAPENFLAYDDFDATPNDRKKQSNLRKSWSAHQQDFVAQEAGQYTWDGGKGSEILGAVHYLASKGLNVFSFLTFSLDGDDDNVFPHRLVGTVEDYENVVDDRRWSEGVVHRDRFDVSKMAQWERVFEYAGTQGLYLHFKTQETENEMRMDGGALGRERKLYYRELIARFSHHLALNWNLGEENDEQTVMNKRAMATYFKEMDPYNHLVVIHSYPDRQAEAYEPMLGGKSDLTGASVQTSHVDFRNVYRDIKKWVTASKQAGKPWVVSCDEPGDAQKALRPAGDEGNSWIDARKNALWGTIMAGGAGVEFYFGYKHAHSDLTCQDYRSRDGFWDVCRVALEFFKKNEVPFYDMVSNNELSSHPESWCLSHAAGEFVIYLKEGGSTELNLSDHEGQFTVSWYNPRSGGGLQHGSVRSVTGGQAVSLGDAPAQKDQDWVVFIRKQ